MRVGVKCRVRREKPRVKTDVLGVYQGRNVSEATLCAEMGRSSKERGCWAGPPSWSWEDEKVSDPLGIKETTKL